MRKPLIAGNWKMYKTPRESLAFLDAFLPLVEDHTRDEVVLFPTMSSLGYVLDRIQGTNVHAGAQTMHWMNEGPYTGQTSPTGLTEAVLRWQIACALNGVEPEGCGKLIIAYEPVWAIGTGSTATPSQVQEAHLIIRREVAERLGNERASNIRILYGGSVKPENAGKLMAQPDIDGALVGGGSLDPETFAKIVKYPR
jgi:triosephosphate isomerase